MRSMTDPCTLTSFHDDGVFQFKQELTFGQTSVVEFATRVIRDFAEKERKRIGRLRSPITKVGGVPKKLIMEHLRLNAGRITFAPTELHNFSTADEHRNAEHLDAFFEHAMPVYSDKATAMKCHVDHCWKVALLNAYRIFDMMGDTSHPFPHGWEQIQINAQKKNFATLLASAAYQMGSYHAMALALANAGRVDRGKKMSEGNKGKFSELGNLVNEACDEIVKCHGALAEWNVSGAVMAVLEKNGHGSTQGGLWHVITSKGKEEIDSKKLGKFIRRYRDRMNR
jgi:hypothetical protein